MTIHLYFLGIQTCIKKNNIREFMVVITLMYGDKHRFENVTLIYIHNPCFYTKYINIDQLKVCMNFIDGLTLYSQFFLFVYINTYYFYHEFSYTNGSSY